MPTFKLNGHPLSQTNRERVVRLLQKLPFGELLGRTELARKLNLHENDRAFRNTPASLSHQLNQHRRVYGSEKTIKALKKELAK